MVVVKIPRKFFLSFFVCVLFSCLRGWSVANGWRMVMVGKYLVDGWGRECVSLCIVHTFAQNWREIDRG